MQSQIYVLCIYDYVGENAGIHLFRKELHSIHYYI